VKTWGKSVEVRKKIKVFIGEMLKRIVVVNGERRYEWF
jgi:hypothetical protein